ncbi:MAG: hypothetical protein JKY41_08810 [Rhodobacteraceae bacterium]|nr:hypothetical protein [Paracoccaceae bacterium]
MIKAIVVVLGLSPLLACVPMEDLMAADAMMEDGAMAHEGMDMDGDTMMDGGDTMS